MGYDTRGRLKGKIEPEMILNYIRQVYDANATMKIDTGDYGPTAVLDFVKEKYDNSGKWIIRSGFITFNDGEDNRSIFYEYDNINTYENLEYYSEYGLEDMVKQETTLVNMSCWKNSVSIIKGIVAEFGGWIDENDCDDEIYYPVEKNPDKSIKPVIRVSMEEIYEKFGGVVLITRI